jgi:hypothetical protein
MIAGEERLALLFRTPPGWPEPDIHWRESHQGWQPPFDWVPRAGVRPAPTGWNFWRVNTAVWKGLVARERRRPFVRLGVGVAASVLSIAAFVANYTVVAPEVEVADVVSLGLVGIAVFGFFEVLSAVSRLTDAPERVLRGVRADAPATKLVVDADLYARYLQGWRS